MSFEQQRPIPLDFFHRGIRQYPSKNQYYVPGFLCSKMIGYLVRDVVLIWDEVVGIQANLLVVDGPSTGETRLSEWLERNADSVGARYASELKRHYE